MSTHSPADSSTAPPAATDSTVAAAATPSTHIAASSAFTELYNGRYIDSETGKEEEYSIEVVPLKKLNAQESDRLSALASKVLQYFDEEAAAAITAATTKATSTASNNTNTSSSTASTAVSSASSSTSSQSQ